MTILGDFGIKTTTVRYGGAQLPVGLNVQRNKQEILKAIDWAKENEVTHLLTPECALSGWTKGWEVNLKEIKESLKEIELHAAKCKVALHVGTNFREPGEYFGDINRNELRHYNSEGNLMGVTYKTFVLNDYENTLGRKVYEPIVQVPLVLEKINEDELRMTLKAAGMICNDMWGGTEAKEGALTTLYRELDLDLIFHATNGRTIKNDKEWTVFDYWHEGHLRMTAGMTGVPILTVDACTDWQWDGEDEQEIDKYRTSSQSGYVSIDGWHTDVPRTGRQFFTYDVEYNWE